MLIVRAIASITGTEHITKGATKFILSQRSTRWSWNYWRRNSQKSKQTPYPDDLDDTANAFAALQASSAEELNGQSWAHFGRLLIANETSPGGPYATWIRPPKDTVWHDIDPVVNATIGHVLHTEGIEMPKLVEYFRTILASGKMQSRYYINDIPTLYFLASWLPEKQQLKQLVTDRLKDIPSHNALMLSLLITSGYRVGVSKCLLRKAVEQLINLKRSASWKAEAFYKDPAEDGRQYYAGSSAMTTAFAAEALCAHLQVSRKAEPVVASEAMQQFQEFIKAHPSVLHDSYNAVLQRISASDRQQQISKGADIFAAALGVKLPPKIVTHLNLASLHGWTAYIIYDDFLDDEGKNHELSIANISHRAVVRHFNAALKDPAFHQLVSETLDTVDVANAWEALYARAVRTKNKLQYTLPNYGDLTQLASRSQGHMLVACAVMMYAAHSSDSAAMKNLQKFFHHFLIAKQLNDDAHDWRTDLEHGHLSAVVTMLLRDLHPVECTPFKDMPKLEKHFWDQTIHDINEHIIDHCDQAEQALSQVPLAKPEVVVRLLKPLRQAVQDTTRQYSQTQAFINSMRAQQS